MSRVSIALVVVALTQSAQPVRERYLDAAQLQDFLVRTPLESKVLQYALGRLTAAANAPYGLELEPEPPLPPGSPDGRPTRASGWTSELSHW